MQRTSCALLLALSAGGLFAASCAEIESERSATARPYDVPYLTSQIFAPSCGQTQCHSSIKAAGDLVFDNPDSVRESLLKPSPYTLLQYHGEQHDPSRLDGKTPNLITWITEIDPFGEGIGRMPFDMPLAEADIELLEVWISAPREVVDPDSGRTFMLGGGGVGAQCNPNLFDGRACQLNNVHRCDDNWNFAEVVEECSICSYPEEGGEFVLRCQK